MGIEGFNKKKAKEKDEKSFLGKIRNNAKEIAGAAAVLTSIGIGMESSSGKENVSDKDGNKIEVVSEFVPNIGSFEEFAGINKKNETMDTEQGKEIGQENIEMNKEKNETNETELPNGFEINKDGLYHFVAEDGTYEGDFYKEISKFDSGVARAQKENGNYVYINDHGQQLSGEFKKIYAFQHTMTSDENGNLENSNNEVANVQLLDGTQAKINSNFEVIN